MRPRPQRPYFRGSVGGPTSGFRKEIENYTSLNAPRSQVLMWIRANGVGIPTPRRLSPNKIAVADKRFYCQYHREYRHDTDECRELKNVIEQLIQNGKLGKFTNVIRRHRDFEDEGGDKTKIKKT